MRPGFGTATRTVPSCGRQRPDNFDRALQKQQRIPHPVQPRLGFGTTKSWASPHLVKTRAIRDSTVRKREGAKYTLRARLRQAGLRQNGRAVSRLRYSPKLARAATRRRASEILQEKLGDAVKKLDARGAIGDRMAAAGENHQSGRILSGGNKTVEHLGGVCEMNVVITCAMDFH